jgi:hypothetical protein
MKTVDETGSTKCSIRLSEQSNAELTTVSNPQSPLAVYLDNTVYPNLLQTLLINARPNAVPAATACAFAVLQHCL